MTVVKVQARRHTALLLASLSALLILSTGAAAAIGSHQVAFGDVLHVLRYRLLDAADMPDLVVDQIVWRLRLPRSLLAIAVGGGLAVVGVGMQALVRNPLAEPYILGVSSGAAAGASIFYLGLLPPLVSAALSMPLAAFAGGLAAMTVVYLVARVGQTISVMRLLLAGVAVSALMGAVTALVTFASPEPNKLRAILFWLQGSFSGARWELLPLPAAASIVGMVLLLALARPLDALLVGEEPAFNLGVDVEWMKRGLVLHAAVVTGVLVSVSGAIGFVGLIVPHVVRMMTGVAHRRLVPLSFLLGGLFLLWADVAARTLFIPLELPVGVLTALCGVPFFLFLLRRSSYRFG